MAAIAAAEPPVGYQYPAPNFGGGGGNGGGQSGQGNGYSPGGNEEPKEVFKHVYIHTAPEEPQEVQPPKEIPVPPAQKHYKILFIKAPTPPTPTAPVIPVQPQNEEKTLVYVLVKKPEEQPDIVIPTAAPTQPAKPEVYFIKYKAKKESVPDSGTEAEGATPGHSEGYGSGGPSSIGSGGSSYLQTNHGRGATSSISVNHGSSSRGSGKGKTSRKYGPPH